MLRALPVVLVLAAALAFAVPAHAVLITVNFTVTADADDPVNAGTTANGSFSFDSSIILPGVAHSLVVLDPSGLNFTWTGTTWTDANASIGSGDSIVFHGLSFDAAGNLVGWTALGDPGGKAVVVDEAGPDDFTILHGTAFLYHDQGQTSFYEGSITWSTSTGSASEPASWLLLGGALVGLVGVRRRARK